MLADRKIHNGFMEESWSLPNWPKEETSFPPVQTESSAAHNSNPVISTSGKTRKPFSLDKLSRVAAPLTLIIVLGLWQLISSLKLYPEYIIPAPATVLDRWLEIAQTGALWRHVQTTLSEAGAGFAIALLIAGVLCYPIARSRLIAVLLNPLLAATQAVPLVAIAPLLVLWFGFGLLPKVITCALIVFFPLLLNAVSGLKQVDKSLREAAQVFGANRWQAFWLVELPLALPTFLTGVKIGFTVSFTGAVVGEFISADAGLGYLLNLGRGQFDTALVFAALLTLTAIAVSAYALVSLLEKRIIDWQE